MKRLQSSAVVTLTVEVRPPDRWGEDCPVSQIHKQGAEAAVHALSSHLADKRGIDARIVGTPKVVAVTFETDS